LPKNWSKKDYGVMIGYLGASKTLAVIVKTNGKDYLIKTAQNPRGMIYDAGNENMKVSEAFMCYGGLPEKKIDRAAFRRFLWQNLNSGDLRKMIALSLIMSLIPLIAPPLNEMVFTDAILLVNSSSLIMSAQILAAVGLTMAALSALRSLLVLRLSLRLDAALQAALVGRLLKLPLSALRRFSSDDLANRLERLSRSRDFIAVELTTLTDAVFSLWFLLLMAHYSVKITAAVAAVTLIFGAVLYWHNRRLHEARKKFFAARGRTVSLTHQILDSIGKFRTQAAEHRAFRLWSERFGKQEKLAHDLRLKKELPRLLFQAAPFILTAVICLPFAETEQLSRSKFIAFLVAVAGFGNMIGNFFNTFGRSFELEAHLDALRPLLETVPETTRAKSDAGKLNGSLEVSHLAFAYSEGEDVLRDVNFRLDAGEYAAIVGKSGSGKSTLLRLLLGLETPKSGTIYYDGQDMAELDLASLRQRLGVVWQDGELPAGDIFSLIAGTELITEDEAWEAAEAAGIADDIAAMPMGMHTIIDAGGANLSGGQRQRLQIAGALVGNPAIIVFDEATSALDNRTQATVAATLAKSKATRLIIAHRLSTIREADRIFVLDKGVIAESGTFDELRMKDGLFAELMRPQTE